MAPSKGAGQACTVPYTGQFSPNSPKLRYTFPLTTLQSNGRTLPTFSIRQVISQLFYMALFWWFVNNKTWKSHQNKNVKSAKHYSYEKTCQCLTRITNSDFATSLFCWHWPRPKRWIQARYDSWTKVYPRPIREYRLGMTFTVWGKLKLISLDVN